MTLGEIIKKYRKDNKLTMQELAARCELSKGYISMLENNFIPTNTNKKITPSVTAIKKLSEGMSIDFDYLLSSIDGDVTWEEHPFSTNFIIKHRREELGLTMQKLAELVGVSSATVSQWENGNLANMKRNQISSVAKALNINPTALLGIDWGEDSDEKIYKSAGLDFIRIPLYGPLCCGNGGFVEDNIIEYIPVPSRGLGDPEKYFAQIASGESMKDAGINNGDLLVFEKVPVVPAGTIGCFCTDENEATCKKYKELNGIIMLQPMNSDFDVIIIDPMNSSFRCLGKLKKVIKDIE